MAGDRHRGDGVSARGPYGSPAPVDVRDRVRAFVTACAKDARAAWAVRRSGTEPLGWVEAADRLGMNQATLRRIVEGLPVKASTVDEARRAMDRLARVAS